MKLTKFYDFALGIMLGAAGTLLALGRHDAALLAAILAAVLRFTAGRTALLHEGGER